MARQEPSQAWAQAEDLDGRLLYQILDVQPGASPAEIRQAYRVQARRHHPDKPGGSSARFSKIQEAFETLSQPRSRAVYDTWARELRFRYLDEYRAPGGEDILLDELAGRGLVCDPLTQLVVTCEVCRRPATKQCWTCGMQICEFCTLKRHWKGDTPLHWPLINSDHMRTKLAKRELEKKKIEDAHRLELEDPNHRTESELQEIRAFKEASCRMLSRKDGLVTYDLTLARYYMWAQTDSHVFLAVHVPTGYADKELLLDCNEMALKLQPESSPPLIHRALDYGIDMSQPVDTFRTEDNRVMTIQLAKGKPGQAWQRLFRGDPDGARCLQPPYQLAESDDSVSMELELPFWTEPDDVAADFQPCSVEIRVRGGLSLRRTCWQPRSRSPAHEAVDAGDSMWALDDSQSRSGEAVKVLALHLAKPALTETEITWKKGVRQDNRVQARPGQPQLKGMRFFADDEDAFGLEDLLQALCMMEAGTTWVPVKPWQQQSSGRWESDPEALSTEVKGHLDRLLAEDERSLGPCVRES